VPLWAFRAALADADLLTSVIAIVEAQTGQAKSDLIAFVEYGNFVDRASPSLAKLAAALGKNKDEVDALFHAAARKEL
jgi:hypothetical protein